MRFGTRFPPLSVGVCGKRGTIVFFRNIEMSPKEVFGIGCRLIVKNISFFKGKIPDKGPTKKEIIMVKSWHQNLDANSYDNSRSLARQDTIWRPPYHT